MAINIKTGQEIGGTNEWSETQVQFVSDSQNFGRLTKTQNFKLTTYTDSTRTTELGDLNHPPVKTFTVYQSPASLRMLTVGVKSSEPTIADFNGLAKIVPTTRNQISSSATVSNGKYYVYGLSNLSKIRYAMTTCTLVSESSKFCNEKPTNMSQFVNGTESSDGSSAYICPSDSTWGDNDVYYFYFQVNAGQSATTLNLMISDPSSDHGYVITTTASGAISITTSVVLPAAGGSVQVGYSNTLPDNTATITKGTDNTSGLYDTDPALPISNILPGTTNGIITLSPTSKNYSATTYQNVKYLKSLTSSPVTGNTLIMSASEETNKTCSVSQAGATVNNYSFVVNSGNPLQAPAGGTKEVNFNARAYIPNDSEGIKMYVPVPSITPRGIDNITINNASGKITIRFSDSASGTVTLTMKPKFVTGVSGSAPTLGNEIDVTGSLQISITEKPAVSISSGTYSTDSDVEDTRMLFNIVLNCSTDWNNTISRAVSDAVTRGALGISLTGIQAGDVAVYIGDQNDTAGSYDMENNTITFRSRGLSTSGDTLEAGLIWREISDDSNFVADGSHANITYI